MRTLLLVMLYGVLAILPCVGVGVADAASDVQQTLMDLERDSHQRWLDGDIAALNTLMADGFHFVVMNGSLETKEEVVGAGEYAPPKQRRLQVRSMRVDPEKVVMHRDVAVVFSVLHIDASARGRTVAPRMRILSVFQSADGAEGWSLIARSITPILAPPVP